MSEPGISLCTYTYNDAAFVHDLLRSTRDWQIRPEEVVVVDDGSRTPFVPEAPLPGLRVIRLEKNRGITQAKGAGISAARGAVILSMDCDTRIAPDWLALSLPNLMRPGVGLAAGALVHASGQDLVSRYLEKFGDNHNRRHTGPVEFIPGNAFLLRRSTWQKIGGFSAYAETNCQDHYLCRLLSSRGYTLYSDARARAVQLRRIPRTTLCKRTWKWCHRRVKEQLLPGDRAVPYLFVACLQPMLTRFNVAMDLNEPLFFYLDLLYMAYTVRDLLDHGLAQGLTAQPVLDGFARRLARLFEGYPRLWSLFRADMTTLGRTPVMPPSGDEAVWEEYFLFADMLRNSGLFDWLERTGVDKLLLEDRAEHYHFSSYAEASFALTPRGQPQ